MQHQWYETFFSELPNEFWRRAAGPELTAADIRFVEQRLGLRRGARILDVPCGSGRHALAFATAGYAVTGLDISDEAVTHARRAAARAGLTVDLRVADMRQLPQTGDFDAAVCLGNSFGYVGTAGLRDFIAALGNAVRPGGGLVVDFNATAEGVLAGPIGGERVMRTGDIEVEAVTSYDVTASRLLTTYTFRRGDERHTATAVHHVYTVGHLAELLAEGGFTVRERCAGPDGAPFTVGSGRLMLVAERD
ncbi:class I SAM-dependent methyltransferase [Dactylosporangium sp. NPDC005572]|uniref:SAM-dependent methyltransferase n=1 Tax=Dactylosporangium sp. NPDC005572 TaxID=3156889 RepID=UPI0033AD8984